MGSALYKSGSLHKLINNVNPDCVVSNLVIGSSSSFTGTYSAALGVDGSGDILIQNVTNAANVTGDFGCGGFLGVYSAGSLVIKECHNSGYILSLSEGVLDGVHFSGGFVGVIQNSAFVNISDSVNDGTVVSGGKKDSHRQSQK